VKPAHFERFAGSVAKVLMATPLNGRRKFQGVLKGLNNGNVVLETADAGTVELGLDRIERARLVPDYESELSGS
jgi:ribosome maturation factor RimP